MLWDPLRPVPEFIKRPLKTHTIYIIQIIHSPWSEKKIKLRVLLLLNVL